VIRLTTYDSLKRSMPPTFVDPFEVSMVTPQVAGPDSMTLVTMKNGAAVFVTETPEEVWEAIREARKISS
jgi:uncharacterized protein YlzI (FlbEa/FlbD family)